MLVHSHNFGALDDYSSLSLNDIFVYADSLMGNANFGLIDSLLEDVKSFLMTHSLLLK
jgi:hypothetical protein